MFAAENDNPGNPAEILWRVQWTMLIDRPCSTCMQLQEEMKRSHSYIISRPNKSVYGGPSPLTFYLTVNLRLTNWLQMSLFHSDRLSVWFVIVCISALLSDVMTIRYVGRQPPSGSKTDTTEILCYVYPSRPILLIAVELYSNGELFCHSQHRSSYYV